MTLEHKASFIRFLTNCFQSMADPMVRDHCEK
jgi:hypothetical protein